MKTRSIALLAAVLLLFSSCSKIDIFPDIFPESSSSSSEAAPIPESKSEPASSSEPEPEPTVGTTLLADAGLPEKMSTPLMVAALKTPCVILFDDEVLTDRTSADAFKAAVGAKKEGELFVYTVHSYDSNVLVRHFTTAAGGTGQLSYASLTSLSATLSFDPPAKVSGYSFNDYGRMTVQIEGSSEPAYVPVVSGHQLYPDYAKNRFAMQTYLLPIRNEAPCRTSWSDPSQISGSWIWTFEALYDYVLDGNSPWDIYGNDWPVADMIELITKFFDLTPEQLREQLSVDKYGVYDSATDTLHYEGGRGGYSPTYMATGSRLTGDIQELDYYQENLDGSPVAGFSKCTLTVRLMPGGTFRYVSNRVS